VGARESNERTVAASERGDGILTPGQDADASCHSPDVTRVRNGVSPRVPIEHPLRHVRDGPLSQAMDHDRDPSKRPTVIDGLRRRRDRGVRIGVGDDGRWFLDRAAAAESIRPATDDGEGPPDRDER
jgi:hypothetical protein